jgi:hypothetical protein
MNKYIFLALAAMLCLVTTACQPSVQLTPEDAKKVSEEQKKAFQNAPAGRSGAPTRSSAR